VSSEQAVREDDITSAKSGRRQPAGKLRSPSISTIPSSTGSECPTRSYVSSVSQSSSTTGQRAPKGDLRGSTTLLDPASNTAGRRAPTSTMRSSTSTSACTAVLTESAPPEGGFPVFGDTKWGDPITAAQYERSKKKSGRSRAGKKGSDGENESSDGVSEAANQSANQSEQNASGAGSGKKDRGWTKGRGGGKNKFAAKVKRGGAPKPQSDSLSVVLDIELPPGGPGSQWGKANEEW
jgi:hypothetical protein